MNETDNYLINGSLLCHAPNDELRQIAERFPWFSLVKILLAHRTGSQDAAVELIRSARLAAGISFNRDACAQQDPTLSAIEQFLNKGEHRIVPDETTPDDDLSVFAAQEEEDEPITEELAEIYRMQGLYTQAREAYKRLCLLYPKKSVYFAEIIAKLDRQIKE